MSQKQLQVQKQTLNISPQQLMLVSMLTCNVEEMEEKIKKELEENPALEKSDVNDNLKSSAEGESYGENDDYYGTDSESKVGENYDEMGDFSSSDADMYDDYSSDSGYSDGGYSPQTNLTEETSFTDSLLEQIEYQNLPKITRALCEYIIGNLDESGRSSIVVFGTVKAGFAQVETPYLHGAVTTGLLNGSSFVNNADAGGIHNGQWIMHASRWLTNVYAQSVSLPKTGY